MPSTTAMNRRDTSASNFVGRPTVLRTRPPGSSPGQGGHAVRGRPHLARSTVRNRRTATQQHQPAGALVCPE